MSDFEEISTGENFLVVFCRICAVKSDRKGKNYKELTVRRGELIEIENSTKKWWRAKNFRGEIGHVPHNIVEEIEIEKRTIVCTKTSEKIFFDILKANLTLCFVFSSILFSRNRSQRIRQV